MAHFFFLSVLLLKRLSSKINCDIPQYNPISMEATQKQTLANIGDKNFMTEENVSRVMKSLKIKNCEGFDRIPLRILNEGAEYLNIQEADPITCILHLQLYHVI